MPLRCASQRRPQTALRARRQGHRACSRGNECETGRRLRRCRCRGHAAARCRGLLQCHRLGGGTVWPRCGTACGDDCAAAGKPQFRLPPAPRLLEEPPGEPRQLVCHCRDRMEKENLCCPPSCPLPLRAPSGCSCWPPPCGMLGQHIMLCFINRDVGDRQTAALCALLHLPVVSGVQDMCRHCGMVETRWHVAGSTRTQGGKSAPDVDEAAADGGAGLLDRAPVGCAAVSVHHVERVPAAVVHRIRLHLQTRAPPISLF